jgi:hypothetical protein
MAETTIFRIDSRFVFPIFSNAAGRALENHRELFDG